MTAAEHGAKNMVQNHEESFIVDKCAQLCLSCNLAHKVKGFSIAEHFLAYLLASAIAPL